MMLQQINETQDLKRLVLAIFEKLEKMEKEIETLKKASHKQVSIEDLKDRAKIIGIDLKPKSHEISIWNQASKFSGRSPIESVFIC